MSRRNHHILRLRCERAGVNNRGTQIERAGSCPEIRPKRSTVGPSKPIDDGVILPRRGFPSQPRTISRSRAVVQARRRGGSEAGAGVGERAARSEKASGLAFRDLLEAIDPIRIDRSNPVIGLNLSGRGGSERGEPVAGGLSVGLRCNNGNN